jgi:hypothetical protein
VPFTVSHAAAVLPFVRWRRFHPLVPTALVIGSIAPDLPYYLPLPRSAGGAAAWAHSVPGLAVVDLPLGLIMLALWCRVLTPPLTALVPRAFVPRASAPAGPRARLAAPDAATGGLPRHPLMAFGWIAGALVLGAATHLVWDSFTHVDGAAVRAWDGLDAVVAGPHRVYNVVQYVSSAGGLIVLAWYGRGRYRCVPVIRSAEPVDPAEPAEPIEPAEPPAPGGCGSAPEPCRSAAGSWAPLSTVARMAVWCGVFTAVAAGSVVIGTSPMSAASGYDRVRGVLLGGTAGLAVAVAAYAAGWWLVRLGRFRRLRRG